MQILTFGLKMASGWQHLTTSWSLSLNMLEDTEKKKRTKMLKIIGTDQQQGDKQLESNFL